MLERADHLLVGCEETGTLLCVSNSPWRKRGHPSYFVSVLDYYFYLFFIQDKGRNYMVTQQ